MKKSFSSWNPERRPEIFQFLSTHTSALPDEGCGSSQRKILLFFGYCTPNCIQYSWGTWLVTHRLVPSNLPFSHSKSLKRIWGWQHFKLYFCVVLAKNRQASWSWWVSVAKIQTLEVVKCICTLPRWTRDVFYHLKDDEDDIVGLIQHVILTNQGRLFWCNPGRWW